MEGCPAAAGSDTDDGGDTVPSDPQKWSSGDVRRVVRYVSRTFTVRAPRGHLLPDSGAALLAVTEDQWRQVCEGDEQAARIYHAYIRHSYAQATGAPPPPPLPEHQQAPAPPPPAPASEINTGIPQQICKWIIEKLLS
ncbi:hypothetical protein O0L34_g2000 [Tuta absoluta]|nr:hypothetical protein O0L34_g2000 [Tuta absoluta]